jgi:uncharacterized membrane protein YjdF
MHIFGIKSFKLLFPFPFIAIIRVQYQFEEEPFDTVPDLITYYVGSGKAISAASGKFAFSNFYIL